MARLMWPLIDIPDNETVITLSNGTSGGRSQASATILDSDLPLYIRKRIQKDTMGGMDGYFPANKGFGIGVSLGGRGSVPLTLFDRTAI